MTQAGAWDVALPPPLEQVAAEAGKVPSEPAVQSRLPLCVDLDGTLIKTDLLIESFLMLVKRNPLYAFSCLWWWLRGKAHLKNQIAQRVALDASLLPYNTAVVEFLQAKAGNGPELYLCTAADRRLAERVADHLGLFTGVLASDGKNNFSGAAKASGLARQFGEKGFDYCGNSLDDIPSWKCCRNALVVGPHASRVARAALAVNRSTVQLEHDGLSLAQVLKAMRVYQWVKNVLVFVPLFTAHRYTDLGSVTAAGIAFLSFSLCASSVYLLNDMLDLEADRRHARKRERPFASGQLPLSLGLWLIPGLLAAGVALALLLPWRFVLVLAAYYLLTLAYSFSLKQLMLIDVFALASLYTARILAGGAATAIPLSSWLILFSITIFLSLAFLKRYSELSASSGETTQEVAGRGYLAKDSSILGIFGASSGYLAVIIMAIYLNDPRTNLLYSHRSALWGAFALMLFWVSWLWMHAYQGKMTDDPIVFALKNRVSLLAIGLIVSCTIIAI